MGQTFFCKSLVRNDVVSIRFPMEHMELSGIAPTRDVHEVGLQLDGSGSVDLVGLN